MSLLVFFYLVLCSTSISLTLTRSKVFKSLRGWFIKRSSFFGGLFSCTYCMCHWISFLLVLKDFHGGVIDYVIRGFSVIGGSAVMIGVISYLIPFDDGEYSSQLYNLLKKADDHIKKLKDECNRK